MTQDDYHYALLLEGKMDLIHLPAGAVAWLWKYDRPEAQADSAMRFAATAHHLNDPVVDAALLRADLNVMVIHTESGMKVSVYPDGGMGSNGEPISVDELDLLFHGEMNVEPEMGATDALPPMDDATNPMAEPMGDPTAMVEPIDII